MAHQQRCDNVPGKIYLMKAIGYGGLIPGCLIKRYKIGLSRNPEARLDQLLSAQPCCDVEIVHTVDVSDMAEVETELHENFKKSNVKLIKSQEWFDFNLLQVQRCIWLMNRAKIGTRNGIRFTPTKGLLANTLIVAGLGLLLITALQPQPKGESTNQIKVEKSIKHHR